MVKNWTSILKGKVVIVGIGNILRGDDGFGPRLVEEVQGQVEAVCIDAGAAPENYLGRVVRENPDTILFVDAVHLGLASGRFTVLNKSEILKTGFTTHDLSLHLLIEHLEFQTSAGIYLLGVQPQIMAFGEEMSEPVQAAVTKLAMDIQQALHA
jgi:hydrogenase 3 maturation protease